MKKGLCNEGCYSRYGCGYFMALIFLAGMYVRGSIGQEVSIDTMAWCADVCASNEKVASIRIDERNIKCVCKNGARFNIGRETHE